MKITWYGQAAFLLEDSTGYRIICDPYTPEKLGFAPITDACDLVITSSDNDDAHCRHDLIPGTHRWLNALDTVRGGGVSDIDGRTVRAVEAMEIENHPLHDPEQNAMYRFKMDGLSIAHMGDVGNPLTEQQTAFFNDVDILLALAGGELVIALPDLKRLIDTTRPKIVIPMHFRTLCYKPRSLLWINSFLSLFDDSDVDFAFGPSTTLNVPDLPDKTRVLVLDYKR